VVDRLSKVGYSSENIAAGWRWSLDGDDKMGEYGLRRRMGRGQPFGGTGKEMGVREKEGEVVRASARVVSKYKRESDGGEIVQDRKRIILILF
jgi:hypothetical protein